MFGRDRKRPGFIHYEVYFGASVAGSGLEFIVMLLDVLEELVHLHTGIAGQVPGLSRP